MYLLNTKILSELIKKKPSSCLLSHLQSKLAHTLFASCISVWELRLGSALRSDVESFWARVNEEIISKIRILPFGEKEAVVAGDILAELKRRGKVARIEDVFIAASAMTNQFTMVTADTECFPKIKGLAVENWLEPF